MRRRADLPSTNELVGVPLARPNLRPPVATVRQRRRRPPPRGRRLTDARRRNTTVRRRY